ncbi:diaminopimelate epimerase [Limnohabitans sp.]|uniref:diaminopimelate epimerase n=1 Tax=Limnohabitans sp. TaxID=1907725 RepID=UPI0033427BB5
MRIRFTKMQGAGNDFVVLDETTQRLHLTPAHYRFLADRHFGVGADQILTVRPAPQPNVDFEYIIHNADGGEVEQCGNGSRCFVRFLREQGLTDKTTVCVKVHGGIITLQEMPDGQVTVDMGAPVFDLPQVPFAAAHATPVDSKGQAVSASDALTWQLSLGNGNAVNVGVVSMGNPHAVQVVPDVDTAPVLDQGPLIENHAAFPKRVNAGFMQVLSRSAVRLRVFERGSGETLACGTGACAAVVTGIRWGLLDSRVTVQTLGGTLTIEWQGGDTPVHMTGPATTVFSGEITLPDTL